MDPALDSLLKNLADPAFAPFDYSVQRVVEHIKHPTLPDHGGLCFWYLGRVVGVAEVEAALVRPSLDLTFLLNLAMLSTIRKGSTLPKSALKAGST